ncbi:Do family serine endopeptidase [Kordiimonas pumila]|uniref:Do family serine endopeptidase n=1 Tax=Kordiimonas pumila TaxID=2161677 RepID=A0ABV7D118_9PROT|nr:Do family serine endopeptidase [Kordiimonas pumila]
MKLLQKLTLVLATIGMGIWHGYAGAQAETESVRVLPASEGQVMLSYAPVVKGVAPAVVNIYTKKIVRSRRSAMFDDPLFQRFFGDNFSFGSPKERVQGSLGSGVVVRENGVIVTNNHVVEGADEIRVVLADRREFDAEVVLTDPRTDIAILKIDVGDAPLPTIKIADSEDVQVGDIVLAIGNPFGVGQTVTSGIVSATARTQQGISDFGFFIQTDAAVNPGNSGGALVGMHGDLLGINTAIYSRTGASNGIGFAIPANMVKSVLRAALNEGQLTRPWLGIKGQSVTNELAQGLGLDRAGGVLIDAVYPGSPAESAGLMSGDVIMAVAGKEVVDEGGLNFRIATLENGESVSVVVLSGGMLKEDQVVLALPPEDPARDLTKLDGRHPFQGVSIANLSPRFNDELQIDPFLKGVVVLELEDRTPAARWQFLLPGDILLSLNGMSIRSVADVAGALEEDAAEYVYQFQRRGRVRQCQIVPNGSFRCADVR